MGRRGGGERLLPARNMLRHPNPWKHPSLSADSDGRQCSYTSDILQGISKNNNNPARRLRSIKLKIEREVRKRIRPECIALNDWFLIKKIIFTFYCNFNFPFLFLMWFINYKTCREPLTGAG